MQHESSQLKQFSSTQEIIVEKHANKKYVKITQEVKRDFLKMIIEDNKSIKNASQFLRINYSSAKAILSSHKKTIRKNLKPETENLSQDSTRSTYKTIEKTSEFEESFSQPAELRVVCTVGGKSINKIRLQKTKKIFKPSILVACKQWCFDEKKQTLVI